MKTEEKEEAKRDVTRVSIKSHTSGTAYLPVVVTGKINKKTVSIYGTGTTVFQTLLKTHKLESSTLTNLCNKHGLKLQRLNGKSKDASKAFQEAKKFFLALRQK